MEPVTYAVPFNQVASGDGETQGLVGLLFILEECVKKDCGTEGVQRLLRYLCDRYNVK